MAGIQVHGTHRIENRADDVLSQSCSRIQRLIDEGRAAENGIVSHLVIGTLVGIELRGIQIVQFIEFEGSSKTTIQRISLLQKVLHHPDMRASENGFDV